MASRRPRRPNYHNGNANNNRQNYVQPSDYDSDYHNYFSDTQQLEQQAMPPPPLRSNEELNLAVLQRHNPSISSILSLAPYAVVYIFSPSTRQWEKSGVEGTMFVCQLTQGILGEERYSVFVLNRRGLNNFDVPLNDGDNVELTEEYVILKADDKLDPSQGASPPGQPNSNGINKLADGTGIRIYGLWIYSEPPPNSTAETRTLNAKMIRECAVHAGHSLRLARERNEAAQQNGMHAAAAAASSTAGPVEEVQSSAPMGRQISLKDLFGQQRAQDDGFSVHMHQESQQPVNDLTDTDKLKAFLWKPPGTTNTPAPAAPPPYPHNDVLGDLFRRAGIAYQQNQG